MAIEALVQEDVIESRVQAGEDRWGVQWSSIVAGAFAAAALSFILISFGVAIGLGVSSTSPTWRDASAALALLSGLYLILQAAASFSLGGYIAGRIRRPAVSPAGMDDEGERRDGLHGLMSWALAVLIGGAFLALLGAAAIDRSPARTSTGAATAAEPMLSYELDKLFRAPRRPPTDLRETRAEAGRILMTSSSHSGVSTDDRAYLVQQVAALTGLPAPDSERRVDAVIADSRTAINRARRSSIILAFSVAAATLIGAVVAWAAAAAGGRHRDGEPLPDWMTSSDRFHRGRRAMPVP
ncbi:hypothetical protein I3J27_20990 [Bradyrhizobium xenonodulans]|uniref:Mll5186 protein n=1 Tax=Bradyrhizobium xenonodulans TaxID=2736875 RepID=A0ABY7MB85_9BRAD|nr:hypothetical protein [Bradyrhizobium xenonodulans]WBL75517.1 hypothetical protein I3J27_20990 [Bradyrhizobium xenonodulans]